MPDKKINNKNSLVLHRKWRSQNFNELVGQSHIVKTLKNALISNRIAPAYLFSGPRGTGKTSTARILAKAINCPNVKDGQPCNNCHVCKSIDAGTYLDVIEMDAASHTQVEKIREFIVEKVNFRPVEARKKIYIIDEVHKLSSYSFDALLKTIEEPPPFVVFILATTEPEKLPPTIVSRCQRFDFKRISVKVIIDRLRKIADKENFCIEEGALSLIAQAADGALRDALVILEQSISFADNCIRANDIISLLGMTHSEALFSFADNILDKDSEKGLLFIDDMYSKGKDLQRLTIDLLEHFRRLLLIRLVKDTDRILEITQDTYSRLSEQAFRFKIPHLIHIIKELMELRKNIKEMGLDRLLWEMQTIKLTRWELSPSIDGLNRRINKIELLLKGENTQNLLIQSPPPKAINNRYKENDNSQKHLSNASNKILSPSLSKKTNIQDSNTPKNSNGKMLWHQFLRRIAKEKPALVQPLKDIGSGEIVNNDYLFNFNPKQSFQKNYIDNNKHFLENILSNISGKKLIIKFKQGNQEKLFQDKSREKSHKDFVDEVSLLFNADIIDNN